MADAPKETFDPKTKQFGRTCQLIVFGRNLAGLDLSQFRIKFSVKRSDTATPNTADIYVYNLDNATALRIRKEFTRVILQAGYPGNYGVIFQGNIKQVIIGRESATDTFINVVAGDGDRAYNFAVVKKTIAPGSTYQDQIDASIEAMTPKGVTLGHVGDLPPTKLPRGKVLFGNARNYLRNVGRSTNHSWSIQDGKVNFIKKTGYLPGEEVVINATSGMIGTPQQTNDGVNVKVLLNPNIQIGGRIHIDTGLILQQKLNLEQIAQAKGNTSTVNRLIPRNLNANGSYYVLVIEHTGDTRGGDWYTSIISLNIDVSSNPQNSVTGGSNG